MKLQLLRSNRPDNTGSLFLFVVCCNSVVAYILYNVTILYRGSRRHSDCAALRLFAVYREKETERFELTQ